MRFLDLILSAASLVLAGLIYWYTSTTTCPKYGFTFQQINTDCASFFAVVCAGIVLISGYFFIHFMVGDYKRPRH